MRRVKSSIHGVCSGAGPTIVLQPASPATESARFGRRRSSLIFTSCTPETPTCSNSLFTLQRAASSFCSVTGWDFSPVVEDDVAQEVQAALVNNNLKLLRRRFSSPCWYLQETGHCSCYEATETDSLGNDSCFVSCSSPTRNFRSYAEQEIASPRSPAHTSSSYLITQPRVEKATARSSSEDQCGTSGLKADKWLGAALANQAGLPSPASQLPSASLTSLVSKSSPHRPMVQDNTENAMLHCRLVATSDGIDLSTVGIGMHGAGDARKRGRLRRTRRVLGGMNLMSDTT